MKNMFVRWWNNTDREITNYALENLSRCYFVHQKSHMDWGREKSTVLAGIGCEMAKWHILR